MAFLVERLNDGCISALFLGRRAHAYAPLLDALTLRPGDRVLDAGCGAGWLARQVAARVAPGMVVGVDPSLGAVAYAQQQAGPGQEFKVGSIGSLPVADGDFDAVVSSLVIHHVEPEAQAAAFADLHRVLRPRGRLLIVELLRPETAWSWVAFGWQSCVRASLPDDRLRRLASGAGFRDVQTRRHWSWLRVLEATA